MNTKSSLFEKSFSFLCVHFPQFVFTKLIERISQIQKPVWLKNTLLKSFAYLMKIDLAQYQKSDINQYIHLNELFTRKLKDDAREIDSQSSIIISPVDGTISELGIICEQSLIQAKSKKYLIESLLSDYELAKKYTDGTYISIYLAPSNYHRVHFPFDCQVENMAYLPGRLLPVNAFTAKYVNNLFDENCRAIINLKTLNNTKNPAPVSLVMVGALGVGSIDTLWHGKLNPPYDNEQSHYYPYGKIMRYNKGGELGCFNLGSTVILLFPKKTIHLEGYLKKGSKVKMGEAIAQFKQEQKTQNN